MALEFNFGNSRRSSSLRSTRRRQEENSIASDRLQKAIERNRAKQAKRSARQTDYDDEGLDLSGATSRSRMGGLGRSGRLPGSRPGSSTPRQAMGGRRPMGMGSDEVRSRLSSRVSQDRMGTSSRTMAEETFSAAGRSSRMTRSSLGENATRTRVGSRLNRTNVTDERRSVANDDDVEFTSNVKRTVRKAPAQAGYSSATPVKAKSRAVKKRATKKAAGLDKKSKFMLRGLWVFLAFLCIRLIFSGGGVIDYYTNLNLLHTKEKEFENTKNENVSLVKEIKKIKSNSRYQKKLVRDNLGFIASDEYVILFPKEKS